MRVLHVIGTLQIGGAENVAVGFLRYADRTKIQMDYLVYDQNESDFTKEVRELGGRVIRVDGMNDIKSNRLHILEKVIKDNGPYDVVHSHLMFHNGLVMKAAARCKVPVRISHAHSTQIGKKKGMIVSLYCSLMRSLILKNATKLVACGFKAGETLYGKEKNDKIVIANNRIDAKKFEYSLVKNKMYRKKLNIEVDKKIIVMVGHIISLKNHFYALSIMEELVKKRDDYQLIIIGEGELRNQIEEKVKKDGLEEYVRFTGAVSNVDEYMIASDYLIMPSWYEGFPVTLVEAQASGLQCIVSENISKEVNITGNVLFESINDEAISKWIEALLEPYKRENKYKMIVDADFDVSNYGDWITSFYIG